MSDAIDAVLVAPTRDLGGGFVVRRALPARERQMVGPFIFLDQMGPVTFRGEQALDVRPHPHIGLATMTWLLEGEILHRDSLGSVQPIRPGEVNWMTAGRGIVHSERSPGSARRDGARLFGIQTWLALPHAHEETEPAFVHHDAAAIPTVEAAGARARIVAGTLWGATSPLATLTQTIFAEVALAPGASIAIDAAAAHERAIYVVEGSVEVARDGADAYTPGQLVLLRPRETLELRAREASRFVLVGGEPADGPRIVWWNLVSSRAERIEQAKAEWRARRFPSVPGDDVEFIPLPEDPPPPVRYP